MNPDKTEAVVIGTDARQRTEGLVNTVDPGCASVSSASSVRSLGVTVVSYADQIAYHNDAIRSAIGLSPPSVVIGQTLTKLLI
jgi:hypothetical protein